LPCDNRAVKFIHFDRLQGISAGAQVYDSYGQKCNHRFLLNYGFAVEDNREMDGFCPNEVPIQLSVDPNDPLYSAKAKFWSRGEIDSFHAAVAGFSNPQSISAVIEATSNFMPDVQHGEGVAPVKCIRVCVSNNENTRLLFSLLRTLACDEDELRAITSSINDGAVSRALFGITDQRTMAVNPAFYRSCRDIRHPISLRNEKAAMIHLLEIVSHLLGQYPTNIAQDMEDLNDEVAFPRFTNRRHAKIQVRGEKEVLHHFALWAKTALRVLDIIDSELKGVDQKSFETTISELEGEEERDSIHHTIVRYCEDVLGSLRREEWKNVRRRTGVKLPLDYNH
jgi:Rubisco LSMT substrate-binding